MAWTWLFKIQIKIKFAAAVLSGSYDTQPWADAEALTRDTFPTPIPSAAGRSRSAVIAASSAVDITSIHLVFKRR